MPKFLYTVIFLNLILWISVILFIFKIPPNSNLLIIIFLILLFITLVHTFSLPIYFLKRKTKFLTKREIYRVNIKYSVLVSLIIITYLFLKAFKLFNIWGILVSLILLTYVCLKIFRKKKEENVNTKSL